MEALLATKGGIRIMPAARPPSEMSPEYTATDQSRFGSSRRELRLYFVALRDMNYPPLRALAVLSLFCWTLELERLAKALQEDKHEHGKAHRD